MYIRANLITIQNLSLIEFPDNGVSQIGSNRVREKPANSMMYCTVYATIENIVPCEQYEYDSALTFIPLFCS